MSVRASQQWLDNLKKENPHIGIDDPREERRKKGEAGIQSVQWEFPDAPPTFNECLRLFKHDPNAYYREMHRWKGIFSTEMRKQHGPGSFLEVPVRVHMVRHSPQELDIDGLYGSLKITLDALVKAGILPDDDPNCVPEAKVLRRQASELYTTLTIETV